MPYASLGPLGFATRFDLTDPNTASLYRHVLERFLSNMEHWKPAELGSLSDQWPFPHGSWPHDAVVRVRERLGIDEATLPLLEGWELKDISAYPLKYKTELDREPRRLSALEAAEKMVHQMICWHLSGRAPSLHVKAWWGVSQSAELMDQAAGRLFDLYEDVVADKAADIGYEGDEDGVGALMQLEFGADDMSLNAVVEGVTDRLYKADKEVYAILFRDRVRLKYLECV